MMNLPLLLATPLVSTASTPPIDLLDSVPSSAVVVFSVHDLDGLRTRASEHAWTSFLADPEIDDVMSFLADQGISWSQVMADSELPIDPLAFCDSIHESMVAFIAPVGEANEPGFGILFAPGAERAAFEDQFDGLLEVFDNELVGSADQYGDVELALFEQADENDEADLVSFELGGVAAIVGAAGAEHALALAHGVIDSLEGQAEGPGAASTEALANARSSAGGRRSVEAFVDLKSIFALAAGDEEQEEFLTVIEAVGLTEMRWLYASADLGMGEELDVSISVHVPQESYLAAYLNLFGPVPRELGDFLPPDASSISLANFDLFGAWTTTLDILRAEAPDQLEEMQAGLDMVSTSFGLDIEQDLLAQISGTFASFTTHVPEEEMEIAMGGIASTLGVGFEGFDQGTTTIIGLVDADVVELFLEDALSMGQMYAMVEHEDFQGELVNSIVMPGMGGIHWSFIDSALLISEFPTALRAALRKPGHGDSESALEAPKFRQRLQDQADASMASVADTGQTVRMMLAAGSMIRGFAEASGEMPAEVADMPLPSPDIATKYFSGTLRSLVTRKADSIVLSVSGK